MRLALLRAMRMQAPQMQARHAQRGSSSFVCAPAAPRCAAASPHARGACAPAARQLATSVRASALDVADAAATAAGAEAREVPRERRKFKPRVSVRELLVSAGAGCLTV